MSPSIGPGRLTAAAGTVSLGTEGTVPAYTLEVPYVTYRATGSARATAHNRPSWASVAD
jgi:hypothetical protein